MQGKIDIVKRQRNLECHSKKEATLRPGNRSIEKWLDYLQKGGFFGNKSIKHCIKRFYNPL